MQTLQLLFGMKQRVTRKPYLLWGVGLFVLKYIGDAFFYYLATKSFLSPFLFFTPFLSVRYQIFSQLGVPVPDWYGAAVVIWSLPFIWIGVGMTIRRAADADVSPWCGVIFFFPILNYLLMVILAGLPSSPHGNWQRKEVQDQGRRVLSPVILTICFALAGTLLSWIFTNLHQAYLTSLFVGSPLILGLLQGYFLNYKQNRGLGNTMLYVSATVLFIHLFLLLFALEGLICLLMALPIALILALFGAVFGAGIANYGKRRSLTPAMFILLVPIMPWVETKLDPKPYSDMVLSVIEISAPPEKVWTNVVEFSELPSNRDWLFQLGVAHPLRARIEGRGVGAIRHCEFSTGSFVEPITAWEEPNRLAFDVKFQPQPMKELSFYDTVDAPHLNGYFRSVRGEFRLIRTAAGGTRLEGRTWYEMDIKPGWYWQFYGRWFIHKIHGRVLDHIKNLSENS